MPRSRHDRPRPRAGQARVAALPLISACLIVRDEEQFLERCLLSVRRLTRDMVVVDTGSKDATLAIARRCGARVYELPWRDDFSAARNYAIERARGTWILTIDADEEIPPEQAERLRSQVAAASPDVAGMSILLNNVQGVDDHRVRDAGRAVRVFRNLPGHRYVSPVHEQIAPAVVQTGRLLSSDVFFWHYGYLDEVVVSKDKISRNLRLLQSALDQVAEASPFRGYLLMQIGREHQRQREPELADRVLSEALRVTEDGGTAQTRSPHYFALASYYTENLLQLGRHADAAAFAQHALEHIPRSSDLWFFLGAAELELGQTALGTAHLLWATTLAEVGRNDQEFYTPARSIVAWRNAAVALMRLGAPEAALQLLLIALRDAPDDASVLETLWAALHQRVTVAMLFAQKAPAPLVDRILMSAFRAGDDALLWALGDAVAQSTPERITTGQFWKAAVCLGRGDDEAAISLLQDVPLEGDVGGWAQIGRALAFARTGRRGEVAEVLAKAPHDNFHTLLREAAGLPLKAPPETYAHYRVSFVPLLERWHAPSVGHEEADA
jgi:glycosyltransferase involved in cell wall biosynthesis